ncbi:N-acetyltransferase [Nocardioides sp. HDW12B]|uniref:GNAT family N-acetyltransferase n=1 Tax=Nocardioides sp. HDW12B TaxID=2714939 RepID=UPI00140CD1ED|nr:N-acetyltransferase [Nocardioides sp. HDW12B]QIK66742.1 N-acetyltransferase [Nocardioides sp. HDW12B]
MTELETRPEAPGEQAAVLDVVRRAFGAEDPAEGEAIAALVATMHAEAETLGAVSLVAVADGTVVGHVGLTRGWVDAPERLVAVPVLSPLSVLPERQGQGIGAALLEAAAAYADRTGAPLVVLEGAPDLYARHGYVAADSVGLERPSDRIPRPACQVRLLTAYDATLTGRIVYPDVFWRFDAVGLRGETLAMVEAALADREAGDGHDGGTA